jgi:Fe-S-cluster containining protein
VSPPGTASVPVRPAPPDPRAAVAAVEARDRALATGPPTSSPCATCGACCTSYIVSVCGFDVWLICTRQRLSPEQFLVARPQDKPSRDGFLLDAAGPAYGLMLDKQGPLRVKQPCVFLLRLPDGSSRCGIYADRPVVCQTYPMGLWHDDVIIRDKVLCPPDAWPGGEVRRPAWRAAIQRQRLHFDVYYQVVARWNARVTASPATRFSLPAFVSTSDRGTWRAASNPGRPFALREFFDYLLNVYDRLARLDEAIGEAELDRIRAGWGSVPRRPEAAGGPDGAGGGPPQLRVRPGEYPWLDYFKRAREVIDGVYPEVPPQPLSLHLLVTPAPLPAMGGDDAGADDPPGDGRPAASPAPAPGAPRAKGARRTRAATG